MYFGCSSASLSLDLFSSVGSFVSRSFLVCKSGLKLHSHLRHKCCCSVAVCRCGCDSVVCGRGNGSVIDLIFF